MKEDVQACLNLRFDFLKTYYKIPESLQPEIDIWMENMIALGESVSDATEFEQKFAETGLSDQFNLFLPKCLPKPRTITKEERRQSRKIAKEMFLENKEQIAADAIADVANMARIEAQEQLIRKNRETMIQNDTLADYARGTNAKSTIQRLIGLFQKKSN